MRSSGMKALRLQVEQIVKELARDSRRSVSPKRYRGEEESEEHSMY